MSWMLIRHQAPNDGSLVTPGWLFAPDLGPSVLIDTESVPMRITAKCYAAPDGTHYVMAFGESWAKRDLTPEIRADLYRLLGLREVP